MTTALVTGANRGIGLELCRHLRARGDDVIAVCRTTSRELDATGAKVVDGIDVASDDTVTRLPPRLAGARIDWLVLNAGVFEHDGLDPVDLGAIRRQMEVNALGPMRVVAAALPLVQRGGKIAIVTSRMGSIADNGSGGYYGYRMSKAAVNMAGASLARDLAPRGIAVALLHPGYVRTAMTRGGGNVEPAESARQLVARIDALTPATTGKFWHANGEEIPW